MVPILLTSISWKIMPQMVFLESLYTQKRPDNEIKTVVTKEKDRYFETYINFLTPLYSFWQRSLSSSAVPSKEQTWSNQIKDSKFQNFHKINLKLKKFKHEPKTSKYSAAFEFHLFLKHWGILQIDKGRHWWNNERKEEETFRPEREASNQALWFGLKWIWREIQRRY